MGIVEKFIYKVEDNISSGGILDRAYDEAKKDVNDKLKKKFTDQATIYDLAEYFLDLCVKLGLMIVYHPDDTLEFGQEELQEVHIGQITSLMAYHDRLAKSLGKGWKDKIPTSEKPVGFGSLAGSSGVDVAIIFVDAVIDMIKTDAPRIPYNISKGTDNSVIQFNDDDIPKWLTKIKSSSKYVFSFFYEKERWEVEKEIQLLHAVIKSEFRQCKHDKVTEKTKGRKRGKGELNKEVETQLLKNPELTAVAIGKILLTSNDAVRHTAAWRERNQEEKSKK